MLLSRSAIRFSRLGALHWPLVLALIVMLIGLNLIPAVHQGILAIDRGVALRANALLGHDPLFDRVLGWLNTRVGDAFVLGGMGLLFLIHALRGGSSREFVRRLAFWGWAGGLCLLTYTAQCGSEYFIKRDIPLRVLSGLYNLQTEYGFKLRTGGFSAFPSGHAFAYLFFALMAWRPYRGMSLLLWALAFLMPATRLVAGVHWLSDQMLGALPLAALIAALVWHTPLYRTRRWVERTLLFIVGGFWRRRRPFAPAQGIQRRSAPRPLPEPGARLTTNHKV